MSSIIKILKTNFLIELRAKETCTLIAALALVLGVTVALGIGIGGFEPQTKLQLLPSLIWVVFVISAAVASGKSLEFDVENRAIDGVLLTGVPEWCIFVAKWLSNVVLLFVGQLLSILVLSVLMNCDVWSSWIDILVVSVVAVLAYAALATLLAAVSLASRLKQVLLPLILLPLIFPLVFAAIELTTQALVGNGMDYSSGWFSLLIALGVVYPALGVNLFEFVIRE